MVQLLGVQVVVVITVASLAAAAVYTRLRSSPWLVPKGYGDTL